MNKYDKLVKDFESLKPIQFGVLKSFEISREIEGNECSEYKIELKMCDFPKNDSKILYLIFYGVRDIKIGRLDGIINLVIVIESIRGHQLEDLNFRVTECEEHTFSFYCADFNAKIIENT